MHEAVLSIYSRYFESIFRGEDTRALYEGLHLPEFGLENFTIFTNWLYSHHASPRIPVSLVQSAKSWNMILQIYILGAKFEIPALRNDATMALWQFAMTRDDLPKEKFVCRVYQKTAVGCSFQRLLEYIYAAEAGFDQVLDEESLQSLPLRFYAGVMAKLIEFRNLSKDKRFTNIQKLDISKFGE